MAAARNREGSNNSTSKTTASDSDSTSADSMTNPVRFKGVSAHKDSLHVCFTKGLVLSIS